MSTVRLLPSGPRALLAEVEPRWVPELAEYAAKDARVLDAVPGACTVLVLVSRSEQVPQVARELRSWKPTTTRAPASSAGSLLIPVRYDGADLHRVADLTGLGVDEVIARHTAATYIVDFLGFAPGFAYLSGLDPALHVPRLPSPRESVPAGAVAIAGSAAAVYPRASPGGWRLLGHTDEVLFDLDTEPPARLAAGMTVRFEQRR